MQVVSATEARSEWSAVVDSVIREKPKYIKRTRDYVFISSINVLESLLFAYTFTAKKIIEEDGSITLSLNEMDLSGNGTDEQDAKTKLAKSVLGYAEDFYKDFHAYSLHPDKKAYVPYVIKSLMLNDPEKIKELIKL